MSIETIDWAYASPDLNPLENCWRLWKDIVLGLRPKDLDDLEIKAK